MGTFAYSDSYYGLRSFDQSTGVVHDVSASIAATSSIPAVNYVVAKGADASIAITSTISASAESIIIERTDKLQYGGGAYGYNTFDQADLQTVIFGVSAVTNGSAERVRLAAGTIAASSSATGSAEKIHLTNLVGIAADTAITCNAAYQVDVGAAISAASTVSMTYNRIRLVELQTDFGSIVTTIGREKWEVITYSGSSPWTTIAA